MTWQFPIRGKEIIVTSDPDSYRGVDLTVATFLPTLPHPGAFSAVRKHHCHEGVDIYCEQGEPVHAVEPGSVVAILAFTGPSVGTPWWHDTDAVLVEGASGVVCYGEITPIKGLAVGQNIDAGEILGQVKKVLTVDKGRPMAMLHLELYQHGTRDTVGWPIEERERTPTGLRDPTDLLRASLPPRPPLAEE